MVIPRRKHKTNPYLKTIYALVLGLIVIIGSCIFYFNGQRVKDPFIAFIKEQTNLSIDFSKIEFSLLYPNIIKLYDVNLAGLNAKELYLEYDLLNVLFNHNIYIKDLYFNNLTYQKDQLNKVINTFEQFNDFKINKLRIENSKLNIADFVIKNANLNLNNVSFEKEKLNAQSGKINFNNIESSPYAKFNLKDLSFNFVKHKEELLASNMALKLLGGNAFGNANIDLKNKILKFTDLNLNNLILKDLTSSTLPYTIEVEQGVVKNLGIFNTKINVNNINGKISKVLIKKGNIEYSFDGNIEEIADNKQLGNLTNVQTLLEVRQHHCLFDLSANLLAGSIKTKGAINLTDDTLSFEDLVLDKNKLYLNQKNIDWLKDLLQRYNINFKHLQINNLELLSYINKLPISVENLNLNASALNLEQGSLKPTQAGIINAQLHNFLYSDLLIKNAVAIATLTPNLFNLSIPNLNFQNSNISLALTLSNNNTQNFLIASANNFNLADLNSNLIPNTLYGTVSFALDLKSQGPNFFDNLQGNLKLNAKELLISNFALDLINGGLIQPHEVTVQDLIKALKVGDVGIYNLDLSGVIEQAKLKLNTTFDLTTSKVQGQLEMPLKTKIINGALTMQSNLNDNQTKISFKNTIDKLKVVISPIRREIILPGLFDKNTQNSALDFKIININSKITKLYDELESLVKAKKIKFVTTPKGK